MKFTRIKGKEKYSTIRMPLLGRIRLGIKQKSQRTQKEYPVETDYFVIPDELKKIYGEKPKSLPVMLPVENEEMFLRQFYACYGQSHKVKCMGDGEKCERISDQKIKEEMICPGLDDCEYGKKNKCSARTIIQFVLPQINMGAVWQLSTGSINSDIDIRSGIEMSKYLFDRISWVPMILTREERLIPDPATGNMQKHWPVRLFPMANIEQANLIRQDTKRIISHQERISLPEPINENPELDPVDIIVDEEIPDANGEDNPTLYLLPEYDKGQAVKCPANKGKLRPKTDCDTCDSKTNCAAWGLAA